MDQPRPSIDNDDSIRPKAQEELLVDAIPQMSARRVICTSAGLAQFAVAAARALPNAEVNCTYFDLYRAGLALSHWRDMPANLQIECSADLPADNADVVALPLSASGEAELARELIQAGHERLQLGGQLFTATNNADDSWLGEQLGKIFRKLDRHTSSLGALYVATKTEPLKRVRNFSCGFAFRDGERLIHAFSRPGVFSHRRVDPGARHLINAMQIEPGYRVLDIGCGTGGGALAAAQRAAGVTVHAVDSNARAVQCTTRGAELNELKNLTVELNAVGNYADAGSYDLALANPPYYANFRIAEHFVMAGRDALRTGGKILVVTKRPDWYEQNISRWYFDVRIVERKGYFVVEAVRAG